MIVVKVEELPMIEPEATLVIWLEGPQVVGLGLVASLLFIWLSLLLFREGIVAHTSRGAAV